MSRARALRVAWAGSLVALLLSTWPLWTPTSDAPRLPLPGPLAVIPPSVDYPLLLAALGAAIFAILSRGSRPIRWVVWTIAALALLVSLDQLRLQPWVYHALLVGTLLTTCRDLRVIQLARAIGISVYAYAGIAKFDHAFATTLGQQFLAAALGMVGADAEPLSAEVRTTLALGLPLVELIVACLLLAGIWRKDAARAGCLIAATMHGAAILLLSPLGLGHSLGVLVWNACFAWQTWVLFWPGDEPADNGQKPSFYERLATVVVCIAIVAPLSSPWGVWDRWPSWGLYAPGGERATAFVHRGVWERLPDSVRCVSEEDHDPDQPWRKLPLDNWVLAERWAPIYPENRTATAIAAAIAQRYPLGDRVRVITETRAGRISGERTADVVEGAEALHEASSWWGVPQPVVWPD